MNEFRSVHINVQKSLLFGVEATPPTVKECIAVISKFVVERKGEQFCCTSRDLVPLNSAYTQGNYCHLPVSLSPLCFDHSSRV